MFLEKVGSLHCARCGVFPEGLHALLYPALNPLSFDAHPAAPCVCARHMGYLNGPLLFSSNLLPALIVFCCSLIQHKIHLFPQMPHVVD